MFILFGFRTRDRLVATFSMVCEVCGVYAAQAHLKRSTKFTLFFIPLFPVRPSTHYLQCDHCGTRRRIDPSRYARVAA